MTPGERFLRGLAALVPRVWGTDCPRGTPVPLPGPCDDCDSVRLTDLEENEAVRVTCLEQPDGPVAVRLAGAGVLPGAEVRLLQRWPAFVIGIGFAELALDRESAQRIRVRRERPPAP